MHYPIRGSSPPSPRTLRRLYSLIYTSNKARGPTNMLSEAHTIKGKLAWNGYKVGVRIATFIKVCIYMESLSSIQRDV